MNIDNLSEVKLKLLKQCYNAIVIADETKINAAITKHYETDDWLEETSSPTQPDIKVTTDGIGSILFINNKECWDESIEP